MSNRVSGIAPAAVIAFMLAVPLASAEQRSGPAKVPIDASLKLGGGTYSAKAPGTCSHAPKASIYGILSEMWSVRQSADGRSVSLTLWKPVDGSAPMFTLSVNGSASAQITTVRGGQVSGSGTVAMAPEGKGGIFTIDAKGKSGAVTGTIRCDAFTPHIAEGGN